MMVIELRKAHKDKIYELLDEIEELGRKKKTALRELKDMLYECFESEEYKDSDKESDYEPEMDFRNRRSYRRGMREGMRDDEEYDDMGLRSYRNMRMRRAA